MSSPSSSVPVFITEISFGLVTARASVLRGVMGLTRIKEPEESDLKIVVLLFKGIDFERKIFP